MISVVGGGKMGWALASGLGRAGVDVRLVERNAERRGLLQERIAGMPSVRLADAVLPGPGVIVAVKPKDVEIAVTDAVAAGAERVLSIAAGVPLQRLHEWAGARTPVLRAMPNLGAVVGASATALCGGVTAHPGDLDWAEEVLAPCGAVVRVAEEQMDAVTGLSGSGPAYLLLVVEALVDAGVGAGLPRTVAETLTYATLAGTSALLGSGGGARSAAEWRADVTTPAGTTSAGLLALEQGAIRAALAEAVLAATERSAELGES